MAILSLSIAPLAIAAPQAVAAPAATVQPVTAMDELPPPSWQSRRSFGDLGRADDLMLLGIRNTERIDFSMRRDRLASEAVLELEYTPSPSLLANLSHLRVYLNERLMGVLPVAQDRPGQPLRNTLSLDPRLVADFNRLRLEFVGHYADLCEDPANSALWLNVSRASEIRLHEQALHTRNDLARFPAPFFDARDNTRLDLSMTFAAAPTLGEQQAAAILASYFGSLSGWRGTRFPVLFDRLPHAASDRQPPLGVVFATNDRRPSFLADLEHFPPVAGPQIESIDHPDNPYGKLLLILGRDEADLRRAVTALALGTPLLRGARVTIGELPPLAPRKPYDAPNWIPTDRPVRFAELLEYERQLQVSGLQPDPITLSLNLPPDLFVWRNQGIPLRVNFRYNAPGNNDDSRLNIHLNDQFIASLELRSHDRQSGFDILRLALHEETGGAREKLLVPALKVGDRNRLSFDFDFAATLASAQRDRCQTVLPVNVHGVVDEDSSIDLSGSHHYMAMPDLSAFARSGFPFSRMADLSETLVLVPARAGEQQVSTLLETLAGLGAQIGYPAFGVRLVDDWQAASGVDADLLIIGQWPQALRDGMDLSLRLAAPHARLLVGQPAPAVRSAALPVIRAAPQARLEVAAEAPIAALVGMQSPIHPQRSIVALLASTADDHALLRQTLADPGKREALDGSVALIRSSGVSSQFVGEPYYIGHLPWWLLLWFHLSGHPLLLASLAVLCVLFGAFLAWRLLRAIGRRRLGEG
ncbi:cellulose biosynthesis cyclic di-GMP-binding regulatory protein BcsB [Azotobacter armeniacus]